MVNNYFSLRHDYKRAQATISSLMHHRNHINQQMVGLENDMVKNNANHRKLLSQIESNGFIISNTDWMHFSKQERVHNNSST